MSLRTILLTLVCCTPLASFASVAFHYGSQPPWELLSAFDQVVLEPDHVPPQQLHRLAASSEVYAYVSVGEVSADRLWSDRLPASWILGENSDWNSAVIDQSQPQWPEFFLREVIEPLHRKGFRHFFLDTLDSYQLVTATPAQRAAQVAGMVRLIRLLKTRHPDSKLFLNRGFELLPEIHSLVEAVAAESLFAGWDPASRVYRPVPESDRNWLVERLDAVKRDYGLPVTVIDYLPAARRDEARQVAEKIRKLGFTPWVTNARLDLMGPGDIEVMPRQVLMLYNRATKDTGLMDVEHNLLYATTPLNYLGYTTRYLDARGTLPDYPLRGRAAGVVIWLQQPLPGRAAQRLARWLVQQQRDGVPVLILGDADFLLEAPEQMQQLGLKIEVGTDTPRRITLVSYDKPIGFEVQPVPERTSFYPLSLQQGTPLLVAEDEHGRRQVAAAYTPWGGYVLDPYAVVTLPGEFGDRWVVDPFELLQKALRLEPMPVPDLTTASGRRLLLVHMDGDGFANRAEFPGSPFASQVLYEKVLKRFRLPTTISIIEGEIGPKGLYPWLAPKLEPIARKMFALPHVEIASHSYSHPYFWGDLAEGAAGEGYNLPIPGYRFDLKREIDGSLDYITRRLAPAGKPVVLFHWTGDCNPTEEALRYVEAAGIGNINGGDTTITRSNPSLTAVAPISVRKGKQLQVFAPNQNENVYTNDWTGPFYGYRRIIETFRMTDAPRRLKPINIYYHTYAASKPSSLAALIEVYEWAQKQPVTPIHTSRYVRMAHEFERITVARSATGWQIRGMDTVRQLRLPATLGYPDIEQSRGVLGYRDHRDQRYIHAGADKLSLRLRNAPDNAPQLRDANAVLLAAERNGQELRLRLQAETPLEIRMAHVSGCRFSTAGETLAADRRTEDGLIRYRVKHHVAGSIEARCVR